MKFTVVRNGMEDQVKSEDIGVGEIVKLHGDEAVPCDMVVLQTSADGLCFITTANLDGETDLKERSAREETQPMSTEEILRFKGVVQCSPPNEQLYKFNEKMCSIPQLWRTGPVSCDVGRWCTPDTSSDLEAVSLSYENMVLQGTTIRNTEWLYAVVNPPTASQHSLIGVRPGGVCWNGVQVRQKQGQATHQAHTDRRLDHVQDGCRDLHLPAGGGGGVR